MNALDDVMHDEAGGRLSTQQAEAILSLVPVGEDASPSVRELAALVQSLAEPDVTGPVLGEADALAAFRAAGLGQPARASHLRLVTARRRGLAAAGAAVAVLVVGSGAAAAYTGHLPDGLQGLAHRAVGAPAATDGLPADLVATATTPGQPSSTHAAQAPGSVATKPSQAGSPAAGHAAVPPATSSVLFGLCQKVDRTGSDRVINPTSAAHRQLAAAAAAQGQSIVAYCATVTHPGSSKAAGKSSSSGTANEAAAGHGSSGSAGTGKPADKPQGKPASTPGGKPETVPPTSRGHSAEAGPHKAAPAASPSP